jgi:exodeoxyribonuclease-3
MAKGQWHDAVRDMIPEGKLYSWWSYRAKDWLAADRGRRLDHIWVTPPLRQNLAGAEVIASARGWEKPSDHAPVVINFAF